MKKLHKLILALLFFAIASCASGPTIQEIESQKLRSKLLTESWLSFEQSDYIASIKKFDEVIAIDKTCAEAFRGKGLALFASGNSLSATEALVTSLELDIDDYASVAVRMFIQNELPYQSELRKRLYVIDTELSKLVDLPVHQYIGNAFLIDYGMRGKLDKTMLEVINLAVENMGTLKDWSLIGSYQNISGTGFEYSYADESDFSIGIKKFNNLGINRLQVNRTKTSFAASDGFVRIDEYLSIKNYSSSYAENIINTSEDGNYYIVADKVGAMKVWLDGKLLVNDSKYTKGSNLYWKPVSLKKGKHFLVVKIANLEGSAKFRLSMVPRTTSLDKITPDIFGIPGLLRESGVKALASLGISTFEEDSALMLMAANVASENKYENRFWCNYYLIEKGYSLKALDQLNALGSAAESFNSYLMYLSLKKNGRFNDARNILTRKKENVNFVPVQDYKILESLSMERLSEVQELIKKSEKQLGKRYETDKAQILYYILNEDKVEAIAAWNKFIETYSGIPELAQMLYFSDQNIISSKEIYKVCFDNGLMIPIALDLIRIYFASGSYSSALSLANLISPFRGDSHDVQIALSVGASRGGFISLNSTLLEKMLLNYPYEYSVLDAAISRSFGIYEYNKSQNNQSGKNVSDLGNNEKLILELKRNLETSLILEPLDIDKQNILRKLDSLESIKKTIVLSDPYTVISAYKEKPLDEKTDAVVVLDENIERFFSNGYSKVWANYIVKPLSQRGIESVSSQAFIHAHSANAKVVFAKTIKPDGSYINAKIASDRVSFVGVEVGDYLIMSYESESYTTGILSDQFWTESRLNSFNPIYKRNYCLIYPESLKPVFKLHNADTLKAIITDAKYEKGSMQYSVSLSNIEPAERIVGDFNWQDALAWLDVSSVKSWDMIADWYRELSLGRSEPSEIVKAKSNEIVKGLTTRTEIISALYGFVARTIEYEDLSFQYSAQIPQKAESILDDGYGDCKDKATLLIALLKAQGIQAEIALNTPSYAGEHFYLPSTRFNHAIVVIPGNKDLLILDPTSDYTTFPYYPSSLDGSPYLRIPSDNKIDSDLARVPLGKRNSNGIILNISDNGGTSLISGIVSAGGDYSEYFRSLLNSKDEERQRRNMELYLSKYFPTISVISLNTKYIDAIDSDPIITFEAKVNSMSTNNGKFKIMQPAWMIGLSSELNEILKNRTTTYKIDTSVLSTPIKQVNILAIPSGYKLSILPPNLKLSYGKALAEFRFKLVEDKIFCEQELYVPAMNVEPLEFKKLLAFINSAIETANQTIIFERESSLVRIQ